MHRISFILQINKNQRKQKLIDWTTTLIIFVFVCYLILLDNIYLITITE